MFAVAGAGDAPSSICSGNCHFHNGTPAKCASKDVTRISVLRLSAAVAGKPIVLPASLPTSSIQQVRENVARLVGTRAFIEQATDGSRAVATTKRWLREFKPA